MIPVNLLVVYMTPTGIKRKRYMNIVGHCGTECLRDLSTVTELGL